MYMKRIFTVIVSLFVAISILYFTTSSFQNIELIINESDKKCVNYNRDFNEYAIFYPQHQDDEVLWAGSCIIRAIEKCGSDKVYIVLVSDGIGVNVFKESKYKNLSRKEKVILRNNEFKDSLECLGIKDENIIILSDLKNEYKTNFEIMEEYALYFEDKFKSVTHISHSYRYDDHPMHRKNGKIIKNLYENSDIKDVMYFIKPKYLDKIDNQIKVIYTAQTLKEYDKIINACYKYKIKDNTKNTDGIGYKSAHSYFDVLMNDPNLPSLLHLHLD